MARRGEKGRGWWVVSLLLLVAVVGVVGGLLPSILQEEAGRIRGVAYAGAGLGSAGATQDAAAKPDEGNAKEAAAPAETVVEELPPYGDETLDRAKAIRGRVVDKDSKPVGEAIIVAAYKDTENYPYALVFSGKVRSKEDGSFVLGPLPRRDHWLLAFKKNVGVGYVGGKAPGAWVEIVLAPGASVEGKITDQASGKPVIGATVAVTDWSFWTETQTDEEGKYLLAPLPPTVNLWSGHRVMVMAEGYERAERNNLILKSEAKETIDFALDQGAALSGKVLDAQTLEPIPGAIVAEGWESYHETATSDDKGSFTLPHVDTAPNRMFTVRADGFLPQQRQSDGTGKLEFKLSKSETLEGTVHNLKDEPVEGARVYLHRIKYAPGHQRQGSGSGRWRQVTETDAEGKFHFDEVLPGQVAVVAFDKDFAPGEYGPIQIQLGAAPP